MIPPQLHFFVTPRPIEFLERFYKPPEYESEIIKKFIELGYAPVVDSEKPCTQNTANGVYGLVWCGNEIIESRKYKKAMGRIRLLIHWSGKVTQTFLLEARLFFEELLGFNRIKTRSQRLVNGNNFKPTYNQKYIGGSGRLEYEQLPNGYQRIAIVTEHPEEGIKRVQENIEKAEKNIWCLIPTT